MQDLPAFGSRAVPVAGWPAAILKRLDGPLQLLVESLEGASASAKAVAHPYEVVQHLLGTCKACADVGVPWICYFIGRALI